MKRLMIVLMVFSCLVSYAQNKASNVDCRKVKRMMAITGEMFSTMYLECGSFDTIKYYHKDTFHIVNPKEIRKVITSIKKSSVDTYGQRVNANAKLFVFYETGNVDTLCLNVLDTYYRINGRHMMFHDTKAVGFIMSLPFIKKEAKRKK